VAVCPSVFFINGSKMIEITEMDIYPEAEVNEAIKYCPEDCIFWGDD
jgi:ferredoxin